MNETTFWMLVIYGFVFFGGTAWILFDQICIRIDRFRREWREFQEWRDYQITDIHELFPEDLLEDDELVL